VSAIVEADALARYYPVRRQVFGKRQMLRALDGVSFSLEPGDTLAVVGESGCGKSTLARQITLIETPTSGRLSIGGRDVTEASRAEAKVVRRNVQMVFQDPFGSLNPRKKVGAILEEPVVINTSNSRAERRERALEMISRVGLRPEHYSRYPHMFSGGQRQRIAMARCSTLPWWSRTSRSPLWMFPSRPRF
jgi:dipeptide transport system ATP-binding protein